MADVLSIESIKERASQMGGPLPFTPDEIFKVPAFEEDVVSERFPEMNGKVRLRFPNVGDEIEISRITLAMGGTMDARVFAGITTCIEAAPGYWYAPPPQGELRPRLAVHRLLDFPALVGLYTRWISWRDSFRRIQQGADAGGGSV
jgi:hypothetical protein